MPRYLNRDSATAHGGPWPLAHDSSRLDDLYDVEALWADCRPADHCKHCGELLTYDLSVAVGATEPRGWIHVAPRWRECYADGTTSAELDDNAESGDCEDLELRDGARQ